MERQFQQGDITDPGPARHTVRHVQGGHGPHQAPGVLSDASCAELRKPVLANQIPDQMVKEFHETSEKLVGHFTTFIR